MRASLCVALPLILMTSHLAAQSAEDSGTRVILLGTGTPNADPERSGPGVAIVIKGKSYLVDAGPGIVRRAAAASRLGYPGLSPENLATVFITHLHSDHTLGLPDLMYSPWTLERTSALSVYGPPGIADMVRNLEQAYAEDLRVRLDGLEPANRTGYQVMTRTVDPGVVFQNADVKVTAFLVPHGSWKAAYGYRFETSDRVIVISGDTGPASIIGEQCNGCDVLVHEVYSAARLPTRPAEWQRYHRSFHTSTTELAAIAAQAKPKVLVLYHQLFWGVKGEDLEAEVRAGYNGLVVSGDDLDQF